MAFYKYAQFLTAEDEPEYDAIRVPGDLTPFSGIYRCEGCGQSVVSTHLHPLPPQNHHQHGLLANGPIRWRLVVKAHFD